MLSVRVLDLSGRFGWLGAARCSERRRSWWFQVTPLQISHRTPNCSQRGSPKCCGSHEYRKEGELRGTGDTRRSGTLGEVCEEVCGAGGTLVQTGGTGCLQRHEWRLCKGQVETHRNTDSGEWREIPGVHEERAQYRTDGTAEKTQRWHPQETIAQLTDHTPHSFGCCFDCLTFLLVYPRR